MGVYERNSILLWFESGHLTSPLTNQPLPSLELRSEAGLKSAIDDYLSFRKAYLQNFESRMHLCDRHLNAIEHLCASMENLSAVDAIDAPKPETARNEAEAGLKRAFDEHWRLQKVQLEHVDFARSQHVNEYLTFKPFENLNAE